MAADRSNRIGLLLVLATIPWLADAAEPVTIDPNVTQIEKWLPTPDQDATTAYFGRSIDIDGEFMAVGIADPENGEGSGAAHLFRREQGGAGTWTHVAKLTASDGDDDDYFGGSVSISGDTVVVGAIGDDDNGIWSGSAYIFRPDQSHPDAWRQVAKIAAADGSQDDCFGTSVSISGDTAIVGAFGNDDYGLQSGSAYVFQRNGTEPEAWGPIVNLSPEDASELQWFGHSVAVSGDTAVVGAHGDGDNGEASGAVYVFERDHLGSDAWGQVIKISPADGSENDRFGIAVAIDGDTIVVAATGDDDNGSESGSAYVFQRDHGGTSNWGQVAKIKPADGATGDSFGSPLSISGDTVVVGVQLDDENGFKSGSAYVFQRHQGGTDAWGQVAKIKPADGSAEDVFGSSAALSGDTAVFGAPFDDDNGRDSGSVYFFERNNGGADAWGQVAKQPCPPVLVARGDLFGHSVSAGGDNAMIGAPGDDDMGPGAGSIYVFRRQVGGSHEWVQTAKITADDGGSNGRFGTSVAISGNTAIVGAPEDDVGGIRSGSAYIFTYDQDANAWGQTAKIVPADNSIGGFRFGRSVSISNDTAVVGAHLDDVNGVNTGSAYIFHRDESGSGTWNETGKITASDGEYQDSFGYSVAISNDTAIIGARYDDDNGTNSGSAYIFRRPPGASGVWTEAVKILPDDGMEYSFFGCSVAIEGDTAIIGANGDEANGTWSGSVYVFQRDHGGPDSWGQVAKITPEDAAAGDDFGYFVTIKNDTALIGAPGDDDNGSGSGSAYIFRRDHGGADHWVQAGKIVAADGARIDRFGHSVALIDGIAVVGADLNNDFGDNAGSAYVFTIDGVVFVDDFESGSTSRWSTTEP